MQVFQEKIEQLERIDANLKKLVSRQRSLDSYHSRSSSVSDSRIRIDIASGVAPTNRGIRVQLDAQSAPREGRQIAIDKSEGTDGKSDTLEDRPPITRGPNGLDLAHRGRKVAPTDDTAQ